MPLLIVSTMMIFLTVLLSTLFEADYPRVADAVGVLFGGYALAAVLLFGFMIFTRLRLHSDGSSLDASLLFVGSSIYRRSVEGDSWRVIARPGRDQLEIEGRGSYRVEVATAEGKRISFLGPFLCWLFRIECL